MRALASRMMAAIPTTIAATHSSNTVSLRGHHGVPDVQSLEGFLRDFPPPVLHTCTEPSSILVLDLRSESWSTELRALNFQGYGGGSDAEPEIPCSGCRDAVDL